MKIQLTLLALLVTSLGAQALPTHQTPEVSTAGVACSVYGANARRDFKAQCGDVKPDCDQVFVNGVKTEMCANHQLGLNAPPGVPTLEELLSQTDLDPADPEPNDPDPIEITNEALLFTGNNARQELLEAGWKGKMDCDVVGGVLNCANYRIGPGAPAGVLTLEELTGDTDPDPIDPDEPDPIEPGATVTIQAESFNGRFDSVKNWAQQSELGEVGMKLTPDTRVTHNDALIPGQNFWNFADATTPYLSYTINVEVAGSYEVEVRALSKGTEDNGAHIWVNGSWAVERVQWCAGKNEWTWSDRVRTAANHCGELGRNVVNLNAGDNFIRLGAREDGLFVDKFRFIPVGTVVDPEPIDSEHLVVLHHDNGPDPDDLQALIANREILNEFPEVDFMVVHGTQGHEFTNTVDGSLAHTRALFPGALDADNNYAQSVLTSATAWQLTLNAGKEVYVAEGGPSDFTSDVLRELQGRGVGNLKRVFVVQHSHGQGWNESMTLTANMNLVKNLATYVTIGNGNAGTGSNSTTADFNADRFNPSNPEATEFRARALASQYSSLWSFAFQRLNSNVDFSDTVELMEILGISKPGSYNTLSFANEFF